MSFHSACDIEKRSRSQIYPLFLFNLNCPKSLYDSTLEPSKTSVEFKESLVVTKWFLMLLVGRCEDWHPVLLFIEDTVTNLWTVSTDILRSVKAGAELRVAKLHLNFLPCCQRN
ncbi:DNA mismatch repair protein MLH3-like [Solanum stenotomum]|uniref:DNA mismatch repair protein MLH3-like n=1 Tax=Solanum stenotomum TaxID=172797 RepID=UPI0020D11E78|nr:DNA mismatch repair protein MLH3-like [Solanum stenotomum]